MANTYCQRFTDPQKIQQETKDVPNTEELNITIIEPFTFRGVNTLKYKTPIIWTTAWNSLANPVHALHTAFGYNPSKPFDWRAKAGYSLFKNYYVHSATIEMTVFAMPFDTLDQRTENTLWQHNWEQPIMSSLYAFEDTLPYEPEDYNGMVITPSENIARGRWPNYLGMAPSDTNAIILKKRNITKYFSLSGGVWDLLTSWNGVEAYDYSSNNEWQMWYHKLYASTKELEDLTESDLIAKQLIGQNGEIREQEWFNYLPDTDPVKKLYFQLKIAPIRTTTDHEAYLVKALDSDNEETSRHVKIVGVGRIFKNVTFFNKRTVEMGLDV